MLRVQILPPLLERDNMKLRFPGKRTLEINFKIKREGWHFIHFKCNECGYECTKAENWDGSNSGCRKCKEKQTEEFLGR